MRLASRWVCAQYFIARRRQLFIICKRQIRDRKYFTAGFRLARAPGKNEKYKIYDTEIIILFKWQGQNLLRTAESCTLLVRFYNQITIIRPDLNKVGLARRRKPGARCDDGRRGIIFLSGARRRRQKLIFHNTSGDSLCVSQSKEKNCELLHLASDFSSGQ